jgi:glycosyltransferase involved in cell wall biosynthesis
MPSCIIPYPYYYPDDAVSARHFTDLTEGLSLRGWNVYVFSGNRYHGKPGKILPKYENHNGIRIVRCWCPPFSNSKNIERLVNSFYFSIRCWGKLVFSKSDVIILGTNPPFIYYMVPFLKLFRPKLLLALWGHDLYPEAIIADGIKMSKRVKELLVWWAGVSYRCFGFLVDIGSCMRRRFLFYNKEAKYETIVPWAFKEPDIIKEPDVEIRHELFGDAKLCILYSGTIGKVHQFKEFIYLARELRKRNAAISFCFAGRGNCYQDLRNMITDEDTNITFAGFVEEEKLLFRLLSADIHMISLRDGFEGISVPSKFFGSLATGRPLLYCGTPNSCIAKLIMREKFGFVVEMNTIKNIADQLEKISNNKDILLDMQKSAFSFYSQYCSKKKQYEKWDWGLRDYIKLPGC